MLTSPQTPAAILEQALPKNPKHGDVFVLPPGISGGGTFSLELKHQTKRIGFALNWVEVPGRDWLILLNRVAASIPLVEKLVVELVSTQSLFTSLRYHQDLGWLGAASQPAGSTSLYVRLTSNIPSCSQGDLMYYEHVYARKMDASD